MGQENKKIKRCIFHLPTRLVNDGKSASELRPVKMLKAFENLGYKAEVIAGTAAERKRRIKRIKENIKNGICYDFMYSESSTMPMLLTENHHLPSHPFFEFRFFRFLKKHHIKIGLFYRDIYWKFPEYKKSVKGLKYYGAICMYQYDLLQYNKSLTKLYLPTPYCKKYLAGSIEESLIGYLPPGCEKNDRTGKPRGNKDLRLLYIGGIGGHYKIHKIMEAVKELEGVKLTICCHENQWNDEKKEYNRFLNSNITVVHKTEQQLNDLYDEADICILFLGPDIYRKIAMPYKTFEYLGHGCPVIGTKKTASGEFIEKNKIGWSIPYEKEEFRRLIEYLQKNPQEIEKKKKACIEKIKDNIWEKRAETVVLDLKQAAR